MKIGIITNTNEKGQIVIPQKMREILGITPSVPLNLILRDNVIYLHPVEEVISKSEKENSYSQILKMTQGTWKNDDWDETMKKRLAIELKASGKRKRVW